MHWLTHTHAWDQAMRCDWFVVFGDYFHCHPDLVKDYTGSWLRVGRVNKCLICENNHQTLQTNHRTKEEKREMVGETDRAREEKREFEGERDRAREEMREIQKERDRAIQESKVSLKGSYSKYPSCVISIFSLEDEVLCNALLLQHPNYTPSRNIPWCFRDKYMAFLPSSFSMCLGMIALGAWFQRDYTVSGYFNGASWSKHLTCIPMTSWSQHHGHKHSNDIIAHTPTKFDFILQMSFWVT